MITWILICRTKLPEQNYIYVYVYVYIYVYVYVYVETDSELLNKDCERLTIERRIESRFDVNMRELNYVKHRLLPYLPKVIGRHKIHQKERHPAILEKMFSAPFLIT